MSCIVLTPYICVGLYSFASTNDTSPVVRFCEFCKYLLDRDYFYETQMALPEHALVNDTRSLCVTKIAIDSNKIVTVPKLRLEILPCLPSTCKANGSICVDKRDVSVTQYHVNTIQSNEPNQKCASAQKIQIFVKTLSNMTISITIDPSSTINEFKEAICANDGISTFHQRLVSGYREYSDDSRLIDHNATITLLLRLLGGNPEANPRIMPVTWWLGFAGGFQDGHAGAEGKIRFVLSEFEYDDRPPRNWYSDCPLAQWHGVKLLTTNGRVTGIFDLNIWHHVASIPVSIAFLTSLSRLCLSGCTLTILSDSIGGLSFLSSLHLSDNQLTMLPETIGNLSSLTYLSVAKNHLVSLPDSIGRLVYLTKLIVFENRLITLPESIGNLESLTDLIVSRNQLTALPDSIGNLASLTELHLYDNQLSSLPDSIGNLSSLVELFAGNNILAMLPESIGSLTSLRGIIVSNNQLSVVPESFRNLSSLTVLNVSYNRFIQLPLAIGQLSSLEYLDISGNRLDSFPDWVMHLQSLALFHAFDNPMISTDAKKKNIKQRFGNSRVKLCFKKDADNDADDDSS